MERIADARRQIDGDLELLIGRVNARRAALTNWRKPLRDHQGVVLASGMLVGLGLGWLVGTL